jgi:hypothetical protein
VSGTNSGGSTPYSGDTVTLRVIPGPNVAPVNVVPGAQTVPPITAFDIDGITVTDTDGNLSSTQLSVSKGVLTVDLSGGATISAGANNTDTLTLSGNQGQIQAALNTLKYTSNANVTGTGADTLSVVSKDTQGATSSTSTVQINVTANNATATVDITSIVDAATSSSDTGISSSDFVTSDGTLTYKGTVTNFTSGLGDKVLLELVDANNVVLATTTVVPSNGNWSWADPISSTGTRAAGSYTLRATIVNAAGARLNPVEPVNGTNGGTDSQLIVIDNTAPKIAITSDKSNLMAGETALLTFSLTEASPDFTNTSVSVTGGGLSSWTKVNDTTYTGVFTRTAQDVATVKVGNNAFKDLAGNANADGAEANNTATILLNDAPVMNDTDGKLYNSLGLVTAPAGTAYSSAFTNTTNVTVTRTSTSGTLNAVAFNTDGSSFVNMANATEGFTANLKMQFTKSAGSLKVSLDDFTPGDTLQVLVNGQPLVITADMVGGTNSVAVPDAAGTTLVGTARTSGATVIDAFELVIDASKVPGGINSIEFVGKSTATGGGFKLLAPTNNTADYNNKTVAALFSGTFTDADQDAMKGVAVTFAGTALDIGNNGIYSYSSDNGVTWKPLASGLSDFNAVFLAKTDLVRFVPAASNTSTFKQDLTARLVDDSGATNSAALVSGTPVDVSVNGGSEAYSANAVTLKTLTTLTINTVTPDNILQVAESVVNTNVVSGVVTGQFVAGDKVTVTINGTQYTTTVSSTGTWSITNASGNELKLDADSKVEASILATNEVGQVNTVANMKAYTLDFAKVSTTGGLATSYNYTTVTDETVNLVPVTGVTPAGPQAFVGSVRNGNNAAFQWNGGRLDINPQNIKEPEGNGANGEFQSGEIMITARGNMAFTSMSFTYSDLQSGAVANGNKTLTFYDASGNAIKTMTLGVNGNGSTLLDSGTLSRPAVSFGISGGNRDLFWITGMKVTATQFPVPFEIPIVSTDTIVDRAPEIHGTLSQPLATGQVVKIYNNGVLAGNATVSGLTWSYLPTIAALSTNSFVAKVVVNATNAVITEASPFVITQSPSGITPLMLDLNGDGVQTTTLQNGTAFDLDADGDLDKTAWADKRDGLLVMDLNGDGKIGDGRELFGSATVLKTGENATDGFKALADLDDNQDGVMDANDAAFAKLKVWVDANGNGVTDEGELKSLQELGIVSMKLNAQASDMQQNGNTLGLISEYTTADGKTHQLVDVWLDVAEQTFELENKPYELSNEELALINAQTVAKSEVTAEEVAPAISVCTGAAESSTYSLSNGQSLDLTTVLKDMSVNGIVKSVEQVDMITDTAANVMSLKLADVLSMPSTGGVYQLMLSGAANDKVVLTEGEWTDTGTVVNQGGHDYAVYTGTTDPSAQLLIDQHMLQSHQSS